MVDPGESALTRAITSYLATGNADSEFAVDVQQFLDKVRSAPPPIDDIRDELLEQLHDTVDREIVELASALLKARRKGDGRQEKAVLRSLLDKTERRETAIERLESPEFGNEVATVWSERIESLCHELAQLHVVFANPSPKQWRIQFH